MGSAFNMHVLYKSVLWEEETDCIEFDEVGDEYKVLKLF